MLLIEGLGQQSYGSLNWGDGLITERNTIARTGVSDPNPFFQELLTKPYRRQVVAAVHVYPPVISKVCIAGRWSAASVLQIFKSSICMQLTSWSYVG